MIFFLPIRAQSENNAREHWRVRAKRRAAQRRSVAAICASLEGRYDATSELEVTFTRIAPRKLDDDNLAGSMKAMRDAIAKLLGRDDAPGSGIEWRYDQVKGEPREYAVRVEVEVVTHEDRIARAQRELARLEAER